jgi:hypothetical protein
MAKKLSDFIKSLIVKAGGNVDDEKIKTALAAVDANTELGDEIATAIDNGLISLDSAKNNHPDIKKHYTALALNGLDSELKRLMEEEKFGDDIIAELEAEKSSTKRAALIAKKIKELESAKAGQGKEATRALNEQIADLNKQLRTEKDSVNGIKTEYEGKLRAKDMSYAKRDLMAGYKTIHDGLDAETRNIIINAIIDKNMKSKGLQWELDSNGNFVIQTKEGSNAFTEDNRQMTPKIFLDKVMADEKLLVVSDNSQQQNNNRNNNNNSGQFNNGNNNNNSGGNNRNNFNQNNNQNQNNNNGGGNSGNAMLKELVKKAQADIASTGGAPLF